MLLVTNENMGLCLYIHKTKKCAQELNIGESNGYCLNCENCFGNQNQNKFGFFLLLAYIPIFLYANQFCNM